MIVTDGTSGTKNASRLVGELLTDDKTRGRIVATHERTLAQLSDRRHPSLRVSRTSRSLDFDDPWATSESVRMSTAELHLIDARIPPFDSSASPTVAQDCTQVARELAAVAS